jgi:GTP-binding protein
MLLIDATRRVSQVDKKLSQEITEHYKPCVIVLNKADLVPEHVDPEKFHAYLTDHLRGLDYCPIAFVSARTGDGVREAVKTAGDLHEQAGRRVGTGELNRLVQSLLQERGPSPRLGQQARIYYATQPATHPPTIALFVNDPKLFDDRYRRYLINRFREHLPFEEVPIKLLVRPRRPTEKTG